jgi:hypothetical protein
MSAYARGGNAVVMMHALLVMMTAFSYTLVAA